MSRNLAPGVAKSGLAPMGPLLDAEAAHLRTQGYAMVDKPYHLEDLLAVVRTLLGGEHAHAVGEMGRQGTADPCGRAVWEESNDYRLRCHRITIGGVDVHEQQATRTAA